MSVQPSAAPVDEASRPKGPTPSGRLLLRMPPELHAELTRAAERDGNSLNGYITARLTESVGWTSPDEAPTSSRSTEPGRTLTLLLAGNVVAVGLAAVAAVVILLVAWL